MMKDIINSKNFEIHIIQQFRAFMNQKLRQLSKEKRNGQRMS